VADLLDEQAADASILVVEDDPTVADVVATALVRRGYRAEVARSVRIARDRVARSEIDVILLDLGLPDGDGVLFCRELRRWFRNPIVIITAEGDERRVVEALDAGADDYLTKPFSTPVLLARLRVALRHRSVLAGVVDPHRIVVGDLEIDTGGHVVEIGGVETTLTPKEFGLLALLAANPGRLVPHATIVGEVWRGRGSAEAVRVIVTKLRKKLGAGPDRPSIETDVGVGYRLVPAR
jgi:two-component system KDP operon response regulator KdpE